MGYLGYGEDCSAGIGAQQAADEARREVDYLRTDLEDRIRGVRNDAENEAAGLRTRIGDLEDQVSDLNDEVRELRGALAART